VYTLDEFPSEAYSIAVWTRIERLPSQRLGQVVSAWAAPMDDPLRLCLDGGKLYARIEAQRGFSTEGVPVEVGRWYHIAAVKAQDQLRLYLDGQLVGQTAVPYSIYSKARALALGGNPRYAGNEFLAAAYAELSFFAQALTAEEVGKLARRVEPSKL
jgi:hypothetical protein